MELLPDIATGDLSEWSVPEVIAAAFRSSTTGTIAIEQGAGESRLYLRYGVPCGSLLFVGFKSFGYYLLEEGLLDPESLERTLGEAARQGRRHGDILVEQGFIDARRLDALLHKQHVANLASLCLVREGRYEFRGWERPPAWTEALTLDPLRVVVDALRSDELFDRRSAIWDALAATGVRRSAEFDGLFRRFRLEPAERGALEATPGACPPDSIGEGFLDRDHAEAFVCALALLGALEPDTDGAAASSAVAPVANAIDVLNDPLLLPIEEVPAESVESFAPASGGPAPAAVIVSDAYSLGDSQPRGAAREPAGTRAQPAPDFRTADRRTLDSRAFERAPDQYGQYSPAVYPQEHGDAYPSSPYSQGNDFPSEHPEYGQPGYPQQPEYPHQPDHARQSEYFQQSPVDPYSTVNAYDGYAGFTPPVEGHPEQMTGYPAGGYGSNPYPGEYPAAYGDPSWAAHEQTLPPPVDPLLGGYTIPGTPAYGYAPPGFDQAPHGSYDSSPENTGGRLVASSEDGGRSRTIEFEVEDGEAEEELELDLQRAPKEFTRGLLQGGAERREPTSPVNRSQPRRATPAPRSTIPSRTGAGTPIPGTIPSRTSGAPRHLERALQPGSPDYNPFARQLLSQGQGQTPHPSAPPATWPHAQAAAYPPNAPWPQQTMGHPAGQPLGEESSGGYPVAGYSAGAHPWPQNPHAAWPTEAPGNTNPGWPQSQQVARNTPANPPYRSRSRSPIPHTPDEEPEPGIAAHAAALHGESTHFDSSEDGDELPLDPLEEVIGTAPSASAIDVGDVGDVGDAGDAGDAALSSHDSILLGIAELVADVAEDSVPPGPLNLDLADSFDESAATQDDDLLAIQAARETLDDEAVYEEIVDEDVDLADLTDGLSDGLAEGGTPAPDAIVFDTSEITRDVAAFEESPGPGSATATAPSSVPSSTAGSTDAAPRPSRASQDESRARLRRRMLQRAFVNVGTAPFSKERDVTRPHRAFVQEEVTSRTGPHDPALERDVEARYAKLSSADYFEVLGVDQEANTQRIKDAFLDLAKRYHPDRLTAAGQGHLLPQVRAIFAKVKEAYDTLVDPESRAKYRQRDPGTKRPALSSQQAKLCWQKALIHFKRRDFPAAEAELRRATAADPRPEYLAELAWVLFSNPQTREAHRSEISELVARALEENSEQERPCVVAGHIARHDGQNAAAERHFRQALEWNPKSIEAARELRALEARKVPEKKAGFFDRLKRR